MSVRRWSALKCLACVLVGMFLCGGTASAEESSVLGGSGPSPLESPLVVPEVNQLLGGQPALEAEEARRASPEAVAAREASQTEYEGLNAEASAKLAEQVFPEVIERPDGGVPQLPEGGSVTGYPADNVAEVDLPGGQHGVLESMGPIAAETAPGRRVAMNLGLVESNGVFEPQTPAVRVGIPRELQNGVSLGETGVSLTPATEAGGPIGGVEGRLDGSVVFYGGVGVGSDVDEVVKPEPTGFSEDAVLRSAASPGRLVYRVGLPEGASLVKAGDGSGVVNIVDRGAVIARILVPVAHDAAGVVVPVSLGVEGDLLVLSVDKEAGAYEFPIMVDPVVTEDPYFTKTSGHNTNWHFTHKGSHFTGAEDGNSWYMLVEGFHEASEWGALEYTAPGEARILQFKETAGMAKGMPSTQHVENYMEVFSSKNENEGGRVALPTEGVLPHHTITMTGSTGNTAAFFMAATHIGETPEEGKLQLGETGSSQVSVLLSQEKGPEVNVDTSHEYVDGGRKNVFYGGGGWIGPNSGAFEFHAKDPGVGIREYVATVEKEEKRWTEKDFLFSTECSGVVCPEEINHGVSYNSEMSNGEDSLKVVATGFDGSATTTETLKVDSEPPHGITFSGLPSTHEISDGQHFLLEASAKGSPAGLASIMLEIDGQAISGPQGACSGSECTGHASWTLSGENYAAGEHTLTVVATDNAGNVTEEEYHVKIHHAEGVAVGPGSVNPVTGELSLATSDVSVGVPGGALTVNRGYRSRHNTAQGTEGPLGPQWIMSLGAQQSLSRVSGGMLLTSSSGEQVVFESKGGGEFTSPTGDAGLVLIEKPGEKPVFTLSEDGSVTTFELPTGSSGSVWTPSSTEGPNGTNMTLYKFKVAGGVIEPTEDLAPVPAGVSCGKEVSELKEGCRALKFEYATETKAKGEKASEWNTFAGHLSEVKYIAWNASKTKTETTVAEYAYDKKGRLRAEWDPQITPSPLKTTYGYDAEGHVSAVSAPGREPWLLEDGTIPSDASPGRLLAVSVPSAGTAFGSGEAPVNKEVPTLSSTKPVVGTKVSINLTSEKTPGTWTGSPLAFIYQWEDCNSSGKECTPIPGAVNQAYYPVAGDEGHTLVAEAIALNATGAVSASSLATSTVASGTPNTPLPEAPSVGSNSVTTLEYRVPVSGSGAPYEMSSTELAQWGQTDDPSEAMAVFPPDKVMGWPAKEYKRETVLYLDGKDRTVNTALPTGGISTVEYNPYNDVKRTLSPGNRKKALEETGKTAEASKLLDSESSYEEGGSEPGTELLSTLGPQHTVKLAVGKEGKTNEEVLARAHTSYFYNEGAPAEGGPYHLVTKMIEGAETASKEEFDRRTTETSYSGQEGLGWKLRKPTSVTTDPSGLGLVHTTEYNSSTGDVIETKMPAATGKDTTVPPTYSAKFGSKGSAAGQVSAPNGDAIDAHGNVWVADYSNNRVDEFSSSGTFIEAIGFEVKTGGTNKFEICTSGCKAGVAGSGEGQFSGPTGITISGGSLYVSDYKNDRIEEFNEKGEYTGKFGSKGTGAGQLEGPQAVAVASGGDVWIADTGNNRLDEFSSAGTFIEAIGFDVKTGGTNKFEICTSGCKTGSEGSGEGQFSDIRGVTISNNDVYAIDYVNNRAEKFGEKGEYIGEFGVKGPEGIAVAPTSGNLYVTDWADDRVDEFTPAGAYLAEFGMKGSSNGQLKGPEGVAVNSSNAIYVVDTENSRIEDWTPTITGNEGAHNTKTIYYTTAANSEYKECGEHPEMANLPCETTPAAQPGTSGLPELPTTKATYNIWSEPETTTETVGSTTRTTTDTYDTAGRPKTNSAVCKEAPEKICPTSVMATLPTVTDEYNSETGTLEKQSTTTESKTKTITSLYNKLGQLESYTDADANTTTYEYETEKDDRLKKINDKQGTETFEYNETNGLVKELTYTNGTTKMTFGATYDIEGNLLTETYPNGMTATYTYNPIDKPRSLVYKKTTNCTEEEKEKCKWFKDTIVPSIHGQWITQTSTFSHQAYTYDTAGRLTQAQNTPTGKGCTTRIYSYDEDTNRTNLTTRESSTEKCATEGGKTQEHTYDTADRLTDPGTAYNTFGDITTLPAGDAEENAEHALTNTYYTDNQVASQTQNKQTIGYNLDPTGRTRETISTGEPNNTTIISHYPEPSNDPAWTTNPISGEWRRNITGIGGSLVAIQNNGETPELQLTDLHGDIIAKAYLSETATELAAKADTSEFGVPTVTAPAKYAWLGASELPTELPSGVISMGARSYVPQIGRFLQPDPAPGGSANAYTYTFGDPVNTTDPTGAYVECTYCTEHFDQLNQEAVEQENARIAAREAAARAAAEKAAQEAAEAAALAGPQYAGEEEWEEWEEWEEGGYEYIAESGPSGEESDVEPAILVQPLNGEEAGLRFPVAGPVCSTSECKRERRGRHGSRNEGGTGSCRSGGKRVHGRCQQGVDTGSNGSVEVCAGLGGFLGGAVGTAAGGPVGGAAGSAAGAEAGAKACGG